MGWMVPAAIVAGSVITGWMSNQAQQQAGTDAANAQRDASGLAAAAQLEGTRMSVEEQRRQFDLMQERFAETQKLLAPYVEAGETALTKQQAMAGTFGPDLQKLAMDVSGSRLFNDIVGQGEDAILQNQAATGGVRGGNTQGVLARYRPGMLKSEIESQYQKLQNQHNMAFNEYGNLASIGQNAAVGVGNAGQQAAGFGAGGIANTYANQGANMANLYSGMGDIAAQQALYSGASTANMYSGIGSGIGLAASMYRPSPPSGNPNNPADGW